MDKIFIHRLRTHGIIGVYEHERKAPQEILVSAILYTDTRSAASSDALEDCIDYDALSKKLQIHVESVARFTLEALAEDLARICLLESGAKRVVLRVEKPQAIQDAEAVGVEIERTRSEND
jgi:FolB domain-containing protein